jgi:hypothetical protein
VPGRLSPAALPRGLKLLPALLLAALASGCTTALCHGLASAFEEAPSAAPVGYGPAGEPDGEGAELLARFAPAFVVEAGSAGWNRIGTPTLSRRAGVEWARVDPVRPALYAERRAEAVGGRELWQLVYRVHFDQLAFTARGAFSLHRNAGLLVLVTVDRTTEVPLLVTTVHSCGCWLAVVPTEALDAAALPPDWPADRQEVAGESLPARLAVPAEGERFVVHLATRTHRVRDLALGAGGPLEHVPLPLRSMDELHRLPVAGADGETGSFFHEAGYLRGYVKGAWAPLEGLTLGLLTLDPRLGMDRDFGDPDETGARFFTALAPWKRAASRHDRLERALAELGFRTAAFGPAP